MKILLVEDDRATRKMLENALATRHYSVEVALDGRSAIGLAEQFEYDLIVLDVGIPEMDGIGVCKRLRTQGCQTPILLLTGKDGVSDRIMGLDAGADDYMVKPFNLPELLARIRALLRRGKTTTSSIVTWENLQLDSGANEIRYKEQVLRLTPKEYGILELLLLNPHRIFSRAALIDRLWEMEETPTESAISSHVKAIRQKLKAAGAIQDLIETMYGFGYRLRPLEANLPPSSSSKQEELAALHPPLHSLQETIEERQTKKELDDAIAAHAMMLELWEQFKDSFGEQIDLLDRAIAALQQGNLTTDLWQSAKQTVHKLIGSLGVYGFPQGSVLARQIEDLLGSDLHLCVPEIEQMSLLVAKLKQELQQEPVFDPPSHDGGDQGSSRQDIPLVLVVDDDDLLTARLKTEASSRSLQIEVAANLAIAQQALECNLPDAILLDLTFGDGKEDGLTWLGTLQQKHPQIPVLVFTGRDSLSDRVAAARLGAQAFLQKPIALDPIFGAIQTSLRQVQAKVRPSDRTMMGKVMIVDDDLAIGHRLSVLLSPWGLQVTFLSDPARFWEVLTSTIPDLLILDIEMPRYSGIDLCQVVRNDAKWGNLPILFLTAHHEAETIVRAFAVGGDDYIRKPILEPELIARVLNRLEPGQIRRQQLMSTLMEQPSSSNYSNTEGKDSHD
ncbi:response regulator [Tumidithrix elongata RA019]|uniref:Response regulator n=1 Tax=Tumidithrix elongata BACA0141 TaxID=2716417 RepID=A0AAW9Q653_9CYAN|nr:response regulator [Tumidithrix elongata RA019]